MKFQTTDRFHISEEVLSQEVNGETVLLDLEGEAYFGLNEVGTRIWQLLQAEPTVVETLDTGRLPDGRLYMVMEWMDQGDVWALKRSHNMRVAPREACTGTSSRTASPRCTVSIHAPWCATFATRAR